MYLAIEGIDTAGKSTQIELLKKIYPNAIFTREPGGSELGVSLREILLNGEMQLSKEAEFLLFLSDRAEHINKVIRPNLSSLIISDRSLISGIAYAQNLDFSQVLALNTFATQEIFPSCVILLELTQEELQKRLSAKKQDDIEKRGVEYLLFIQKRMIEASQALKIPLVRIDARRPIEEIHAHILQSLQ